MNLYEVTFEYFCMDSVTEELAIQATSEQDARDIIEDQYSHQLNFEIISITQVN